MLEFTQHRLRFGLASLGRAGANALLILLASEHEGTVQA